MKLNHFALLALVAACAAPADRSIQAAEHPVAPPLALSGSAYEAAARLRLPETPPGNYDGLHNVYALGERIISGSEPEGDAAFAELARRGVKTILSVDGKMPDQKAAAKHGMRYVHVPIQYSGITRNELLSIAKTFRELDGPFYVHCFHGKHRGPAGAAVGRLVLDGVSREEAIAEMRQWCSTASKYEGLYRDIATAAIPTAQETSTHDFDFSPAHEFAGLRGVMIGMTRKWDLVKAARKNGWQPDPSHPDVVPLQEATQLHQLYAAMSELSETATRPDDFRTWMSDGKEASEKLLRALSSCTQDAEAAETWRQDAADAFRAVGESCSACHKAYRN